MPAHHRLARARRWVPQVPGRVDRLVRKSRATHNTVALEEAVNAWLGIRPGDQVTYKVQGFDEVGRVWREDPLAGLAPATTRGGQLAEAVLRHSVAEELERRESKDPGPPPDGWFARAARALLDRHSPPAPCSPPRRYASSSWTFDGLGDKVYHGPVSFTLDQATTRRDEGETTYLGFAWPPAGNESRPARWPGQDDNKNRSKDMGTTNGADGVQGMDEDKGKDVAQDVTVDQQTLEQWATIRVQDLTARLLDGIRHAEGLGLEVRVEQEFKHTTTKPAGRRWPLTESIRVGVTKVVG